MEQEKAEKAAANARQAAQTAARQAATNGGRRALSCLAFCLHGRMTEVWWARVDCWPCSMRRVRGHAHGVPGRMHRAMLQQRGGPRSLCLVVLLAYQSGSHRPVTRACADAETVGFARV